MNQFLGQVDNLFLRVNVKNDAVDFLSSLVLAGGQFVLVDDQSSEPVVHLNDQPIIFDELDLSHHFLTDFVLS